MFRGKVDNRYTPSLVLYHEWRIRSMSIMSELLGREHNMEDSRDVRDRERRSK